MEDGEFGEKSEKKCGLCGHTLKAHQPGSDVLKACMALFEAKFKKSIIDKAVLLTKGVFTMAEFTKSLNPASKTLYLPARVRVTDTGVLKFQGEGNMELQVLVDPKITEWVKGLPHQLASLAGTGVMYAACQVVPHDKADPKVADFAGPVRVQMKGAALNRDWGAEFVVDNSKLRNWAEQYHKFLSTKEQEKSQQATGSLLEEEEPEED